jgi:hypothetical protein
MIIIEICLGLKKRREEEMHEEQDALMRGKYSDPIERFPEKTDQLLDGLNWVCLTLLTSSILIICSSLALYDSKR